MDILSMTVELELRSNNKNKSDEDSDPKHANVTKRMRKQLSPN